MHVALLVATKDRLHHVKSFFESLKRQVYKDFSVVFVYEEQCAHDAALLVQVYEASFPITPVMQSQCGISRARNAGMPYMRGDLIAFPDDDCVYAPDTLLHVVDLFRNNPDVQAILAPSPRGIAAGERSVPFIAHLNTAKHFYNFTGPVALIA